jgi:hypothetical protein
MEKKLNVRKNPADKFRVSLALVKEGELLYMAMSSFVEHSVDLP